LPTQNWIRVKMYWRNWVLKI